ncbi:2-dehydropantoate 2-reductase [Lentibacillus persicus]|uniref:2-dehydropantoate 2-reductase n=1 Tax=Lentibacillus persicus TaxID=640948 RepID=A0A1I1VZD2_9BACI|nr:2-dehydropantoate 2-reductase [Lentibacillus persicus]SFD88322.1 2-dehydropantoate 2-reductase [Lentibacillus persicus]
MKVGIIGGGAIGLLCAYYFAKSKWEVTVYTRRFEQAQELNRSGLKIRETTNRAKVKAELLLETKKIDADLIIIAVKQYSLSEIVGQLKTLVEKKQNMLFVQNGMGHIDLIRDLDHKNIFIGVIEHGVLKHSDSEIDHVGKGTTKVAPFQGKIAALSGQLEGVKQPHFPFEYWDDWYQILADKLLVNAVINPLTALYQVKTGSLVENVHFQKNMKRLFEEAVNILGLKNKEEQWRNILRVCHNTAGNRSSMLRDIESGKQTEIDAISGYLIERAEDQNKDLPYTRFVYESIKGMS